MTADDRQRWNDRYAQAADSDTTSVPSGFASVADLVPTEGTALDLACGRGGGTIWLARRGLSMLGVDASDVAIELAEGAADLLGAEVRSRCAFSVHDLDGGLPEGPPVDFIACHLFNDESLDRVMLDRLTPGGVLALCVLSEAGSVPGPFRVRTGSLLERFGGDDILAHEEGEGLASIVVRATGPATPGRLD